MAEKKESGKLQISGFYNPGVILVSWARTPDLSVWQAQMEVLPTQSLCMRGPDCFHPADTKPNPSWCHPSQQPINFDWVGSS